MSNQKGISLDNLYEAIHTVSHITCTKCGHKDEWEQDGMDASTIADNAGWYATAKGTVYCPKCNQKRIKQSRKLYSPFV